MANEQEKIIIAAANKKLRQFLVNKLADRGYVIAAESASGAETIRLTRRLQPDLLVIDEDLQGLPGFDVASIFVQEEIVPVLFLARNFSPAIYHKSANTCYFHVLRKPIEADSLAAGAALLLNSSRRIRQLEKEVSQLRGKNVTERAVLRAKLFLMDSKGLSEQEAHRYLQKESMKRGLPIGDIAAELIKNNLPEDKR